MKKIFNLKSWFKRSGDSSPQASPSIDASMPGEGMAVAPAASGMKRGDKVFIAVAVVAILITVGLVLMNTGYGSRVLGYLHLSPQMSKEQVAQKALDYINGNLLQGQTATLGTISEESGVVKMQVKVGSNSYDSYATTDGKLFFPEAFNLSQPPPAQ